MKGFTVSITIKRCPKCNTILDDNLPKFCPTCKDPDDNQPLPLDEHEGVLFCSGPFGENPCGFQYEIKTGKRFKYVNRKPLFFWVILCLITFFHVRISRIEYLD